MHREDNSKYLLYIEPKAEDRLKEPIDDNLTKMMEMALSKAKKGSSNYSDLKDMGDGFDWVMQGVKYKGETRRVPSFNDRSAYRGYHRTECGKSSSNCDYLLENGMITNSLAPYYLKWYRYSIPETEMKKVLELEKFYKSK